MRLHRLEITAFGPFPGTEHIDFDALSDAGLFLIQGPTGAGKTSILDAVCFALYGRVPGARSRNDATGLRSDHAPAGAAPRVVLETTIRGRRLRVTRSPRWERPKLRGRGTRVEQAKVTLEEFERGRWVALSTRLDEAGDLIGRLLGMTCDQFCQVAMLPQGEFAGFLRAKADERRKVLERLFAAEVFTQVENWLADRRRDTHREAAALRAEAESVADRVAEISGSAPPRRAARPLVPAPRQGEPAPEPVEEVEALPAWAAELEAHAADAHAVAEGLLAESRARLADARAAADHGRALHELRQRHAEAVRRRAELDEQAAWRAALAERLDAAARADRVLPLIREAAARQGQAERARARAAEARARVGALVSPGAAEDVLVKVERDRRDQVAALEGRRADAQRLRRIGDERAGLARELERLEQEEARLADILTELPGVVDGLRVRLDDARVAAAGRPGAQAAVDEAARRMDAAERRDRVAGLLAKAEDEHRAAVDAAQEARDRLQEVRQARLDGMAAALARDLRPGEPCRVCGSREHPEPAAAPGPVPGEDDEQHAQAAYEHAQRRRESAAVEVESRRAELDAALEIVGEAGVAALAAELDAAQRALAELTARAAEAERLEAELHRREQDLEQARTGLDRARNALTEARARDRERAAEQERLRAELDAARGDDPTLEARIDRLRGEADALAAAVQAARDAEHAAAELASARERAARAAAEAGFAAPDDALAAELADERRRALDEQARDYDDRRARVQAVLDDPQTAAAAQAPAPDLDALGAALEAAEAEHTAAASAAASARRRRERLAELRAELAAAVAAWRPAAHRHAVAARMAGLASGRSPDNRRAMSLSAYVLAARLEQVVAAANQRLARMSAGRYTLVHTVDKAAGDRGRGGGGLGLRVVDAWTGQARDPVTLSGGESFVSSLALALGLADVVTAEAGGTEIGTLFVDEGFGTLDEETLDEVMAVLDGLRDGGRAVGVVSHVAELRTRIPAQLRLRKRREGSTVTVAV
ncbi:nuclease SbcCD subunit C [Actinomadura sp. NBRC 104425]|uniref:AAA family ATPase n=1 Tax=Actinomadura sp. NBRC 104425 TaxID=3032204 RepID=UPI0024A2A8C2|nr:SMC family ATPase [Actinomadura sp. NBRC 104425]GLZ12416.1 nuclease SbcCD subunit C [Actinomadura sp. NBRC 104425]